MYKQIVNSVTLVAFVIYSICSSGCTKTVTVPIEEIRPSSTAQITKLKPKYGNPIEFDNPGGKYVHQATMFVGVDTQDSTRRIWLKDIDSVFYKFSRNSHRYSHKAKTFNKLYDEDVRGIADEEIRGLFANNIRYDFDKRRGSYNSVNDVITGAIDSGDTLSFRLSEVESLRVKRTEPVGTALLTVGVLLVVANVLVAATWSQ